MVSRERIEQYKVWFQNLSFFGYNEFILDTINDLWNLINFLGSKYERVFNNQFLKRFDYSEMNKETSIELAQQFFDKHNISIDINLLIREGILIIDESTRGMEDKFFNFVRIDGKSYYDKEGKKKIRVILRNDILDSITLVHELMHFYNQPDMKRSFVSNLLTESVSYGAEFVFCEEIVEANYYNDRNMYFENILIFIYRYCYDIYYIYKIILLYKEKGNISKELYDEMFTDHKYDETINIFEEYVLKKKSVLKDTWNILGLVFGVYFFSEYKSDNKNFEKIIKLNNSINEKSINECFEEIGLKNREELIAGIKSSTDSFISLLDEIYNKKRWVL